MLIKLRAVTGRADRPVPQGIARKNHTFCKRNL